MSDEMQRWYVEISMRVETKHRDLARHMGKYLAFALPWWIEILPDTHTISITEYPPETDTGGH